MPKLPLLLFASVLAVPAGAQVPISGLGTASNGREDVMRRQWLGNGDRLGPDRDQARAGVLVGQLRQLDRQVGRERDSGQISRSDARRFFRESALIDELYVRYSADGLSAAEADELQNRIYVLRSIPIPRRQSH